MNRHKLILAVLTLILSLSAVWSFMRWPRQQTVTTLKYTQGMQQTADKQRAGSPAVPDNSLAVKLYLLEKNTPELSAKQRNIFKPLLFDEARAKRMMPPKPPPKPVHAMPAPIPQVPQKELIKFTFLGFLQMDGQKTIFLERNKEIMLVKAGDVFGRRFTARTITDNSMTITVKDTNEEIVVPLVENRGLAGASK